MVAPRAQLDSVLEEGQGDASSKMNGEHSEHNEQETWHWSVDFRFLSNSKSAYQVASVSSKLSGSHHDDSIWNPFVFVRTK